MPAAASECRFYQDSNPFDVWNQGCAARVFVHIANAQHFTEITGMAPPPSPITAQSAAVYRYIRRVAGSQAQPLSRYITSAISADSVAPAAGVRLRPAPLAAIGLVCLLVGCGLVAPTPARHRPPLPPSEPMPELRVEDVVEGLTALGYACRFDPPDDIGASWNCQLGDQERNDYVSVGITSDETGPIQDAGMSRYLGDEETPVDEGALDAAGTAAFADVLALILPEAHRPTDEELRAGVRSNYPMELGGEWYLGFDRNIVSRSMRIVFASEAP